MKNIRGLLTITGIVFFLLNPLSSTVWQLFPPIRFIQFPWRLLIILIVTSSFLGAFVIQKIRTLGTLLLLLGILTNYFLTYKTPHYYRPLPDAFLKNTPLTGTAADEFNTIWYQHDKALSQLELNENHPWFSTHHSVTVNTIKWNGSEKDFVVTTPVSIDFIEKTNYFPGWETKINGKHTDLLAAAYNYAGFINYSLEPGTHLVKTKFTQNTPSRILGNSLSVLGFTFIFGYLLLPKLTINKL